LAGISLGTGVSNPYNGAGGQPMGAIGISGDEGGVSLIANGVPSSLFSFTRASTATYTNSSGVIASAATNEARTCYDSYGALLGLMVEEQRTNLALRSQEFDNASWVKSGASISANAATAPDGTLTADKVVEDSSVGAYHAAYQTVAGGVETAAFSFSVFVKAAERTSALLMVGNARATYSIINLSTGSFSLPSGPESANLTVSTEPYPNGWWRVHIKGTFGVADAPYGWVGASDGNSTYTGNGTSGIYVWGAQWEAGAFPTSYIPTTTATVTRSADSLTLASLSSIGYSAAAGTLTLKARPMAQAQTFDIVGFNDNTINEAVYVYASSGTSVVMAIRDGGVTQASVAPATASGAKFKFACGWAANDFAASANGGAVQTDVAGTLGSPDRIEMGSALNGFSGGTTAFYIESMTYRPTRALNAELVRLSTWGESDIGAYVSIVNAGALSASATFSRSSTKWYLNSSGTLASASNNVAVTEYDANGALLGLLIEGQRTNLALRSQELDNAVWSKSNGAVTANSVAAPDGTTTADTYTPDATAAAHNFYQAVAVTSGNVYTISVYAKPNGYNRIRLDLFATAAVGQVDFNISTGVIVSTTSGTGKITALPNGWYRCSVYATATATGTGYIQVSPLDNSGNASFSGDTTSGYYFWGMQMEVGDGASSYIPTTSATVTRSADVAAMTLPQIRWNHVGGTTLVEASRRIANTSETAASLSIGANNPGISVYKAFDFVAAANVFTSLYVNGSPDLATNMGAVSDSVVYRGAASWATNSLCTSKSGAAVVTASSGGLPNATDVAIGYWTGFSGTHYFYGHIKNARYWRTWVPNTNVQALAT
jgi:hypothetical protein